MIMFVFYVFIMNNLYYKTFCNICIALLFLIIFYQTLLDIYTHEDLKLDKFFIKNFQGLSIAGMCKS